MRPYNKANLHGNRISKPALSSLVTISHWWNGKLESWGRFFATLQGQVWHIPPQGWAPQPPPRKNVLPVCSQQWHPEMLSSDPWKNTSDSPQICRPLFGTRTFGDEKKIERPEAERLLICNPFLSSQNFKVYSSCLSTFPLGTRRNWPARPR